MKNTKSLLPATLLFLLLVANSYAQEKSTGNRITQTRNLSDFSFIKLEMSGTVYVQQGDQFSVTIEAAPTLIDQITTTVSERTLVIDNKNKNWSGASSIVKVYVQLPLINGLEVAGSGAIEAQTNLTSNLLSCKMGGSGIIKLKEVAAGKISLKLEGSGKIALTKATAENAILELHGSGNLSCENITAKLLAVTLDGSGDITLPALATGKLYLQNTGSGSIRQLKGVAAEVLLENNGSGNITAAELDGSSISIVNAGSGNIAVGACETLNAQITGSGNIRYQGTPKNMRTNVTGSGTISSN